MAIINCYDVNGDAIRFLTQWDHDISIRVTGVETSPIPEFRFSNKHSKKSKCISGAVVGDGVKATIPNGFLQEALPICVQLFYTYPSGDAKTEHTFVIPVKPASMPDGAVYEPVEVMSVVELEKRTKALEEYLIRLNNPEYLHCVADVYVCTDGEYTPDGVPNIAGPDKSTYYWVPQDNEGNRYASWVCVNNAWEFVEMLTVTLDEAVCEACEGGLSAYEIAVKNGFNGSEQEWLESLKGKDGKDGQDGGPGKDGVDGQPGRDGADGKTPVKGTDYFTSDEIQEIAEQAAEMVDVAAQIQAFEQGHDLELITSFKLTEAVSSLDITADADGNPFELETAVIELHTGTDGSCGEGSSGSVQINFGEAKYPYRLRLTDASGFPYRGTASGTAYRDTGFTAYATTRNKLGLCGGYTGGFNAFDAVMLTMQNYKYLDSPISRINVLGNLPVNAAISVYGVRGRNGNA